MIVDVYKDIVAGSPGIKYADTINRVMESTGIGRVTVRNTISQYKQKKTLSSPNKSRAKPSLFDKIDDQDRTGLRRKVHSVWLNRELPTVDRILLDVNEDPSLPNFKRTSLYRVIKKLDFVFAKRKRCTVLTEKEDLIVWRRKYLHDVREYRKDGRTVYYVDETWLNADDRLHVALHVGSENGFLPGGLLCLAAKKNTGDYHDEISGDDFRGWFESVIPALEPNSVIVVDNAPCHSVEVEKYPNGGWKKESVREWLVSKNVVLDRPMLKPELLAKARALRPRRKEYVLDALAEDKGHAVLRLPPYHCGLNPMELAWAMVKGHVKQNGGAARGADGVRRLLDAAIERVAPRDWRGFIEHVVEEEDRLWTVDDIMDDTIDAMEPCVPTTGETTSANDSD